MNLAKSYQLRSKFEGRPETLDKEIRISFVKTGDKYNEVHLEISVNLLIMWF